MANDAAGSVEFGTRSRWTLALGLRRGLRLQAGGRELVAGSFGHSLAPLDEGLVVGAPGASNGALAAGLACVFELSHDSDGDGVDDPVDRCPLAPAPAPSTPIGTAASTTSTGWTR